MRNFYKILVLAVAVSTAVLSSFSSQIYSQEIKLQGKFDKLRAIKVAEEKHQSKLIRYEYLFQYFDEQNISESYTHFNVQGYDAYINPSRGLGGDKLSVAKLIKLDGNFNFYTSASDKLLDLTEDFKDTFAFFDWHIDIHYDDENMPLGEGFIKPGCELNCAMVFSNEIKTKEDAVKLIYSLASNTPSMQGESKFEGPVDAVAVHETVKSLIEGKRFSNFSHGLGVNKTYEEKIKNFNPKNFQKVYIMLFEDSEGRCLGYNKDGVPITAYPSGEPDRLFLIIEK